MKRLLLSLVALMSLGLTACSPTTINAVWKDPEYTKQPTKVLVLAMLKSQTNRRFLEDEFGRQLQKHGVNAVAAYKMFGDTIPEDKELVRAKIKEAGIDTLLLCRLVDSRSEARYVPGSAYTVNTAYYGSWPGYYGTAYTTSYIDPGYMVTDEFAIAESNLYNVETEALVMAVSTETWLNDPAIGLIKDYAATVTNAMVDEGVLK